MKKYLPALALTALLGSIAFAPAVQADIDTHHVHGQMGDIRHDNKLAREQQRSVRTDNRQYKDAEEARERALAHGDRYAAMRDKEHMDHMRSERIKHEHDLDAIRRTRIDHEHLKHAEERHDGDFHH